MISAPNPSKLLAIALALLVLAPALTADESLRAEAAAAISETSELLERQNTLSEELNDVALEMARLLRDLTPQRLAVEEAKVALQRARANTGDGATSALKSSIERYNAAVSLLGRSGGQLQQLRQRHGSIESRLDNIEADLQRLASTIMQIETAFIPARDKAAPAKNLPVAKQADKVLAEIKQGASSPVPPAPKVKAKEMAALPATPSVREARLPPPVKEPGLALVMQDEPAAPAKAVNNSPPVSKSAAVMMPMPKSEAPRPTSAPVAVKSEPIAKPQPMEISEASSAAPSKAAALPPEAVGDYSIIDAGALKTDTRTSSTKARIKASAPIVQAAPQVPKTATQIATAAPVKPLAQTAPWPTSFEEPLIEPALVLAAPGNLEVLVIESGPLLAERERYWLQSPVVEFKRSKGMRIQSLQEGVAALDIRLLQVTETVFKANVTLPAGPARILSAAGAWEIDINPANSGQLWTLIWDLTDPIPVLWHYPAWLSDNALATDSPLR